MSTTAAIQPHLQLPNQQSGRVVCDSRAFATERLIFMSLLLSATKVVPFMPRMRFDRSGLSWPVRGPSRPWRCNDCATPLLAEPSSLGIAQPAKRHAEDVLPDELPPAEQTHRYGHILRDIPAV